MLEKLLQRRYLIYYVLLIALIVRLLLLFNGQRFIDGDEGVVGMMAHHITEGARPISHYRHHYGSGHVLEAYLAAILFAATGITNSSILLKLPVVFFSLFVIFMTYVIVRRFASLPLAVTTASLMVFAAPYLRTSFKVSAYVDTIFFCLLSFYYFGLIIFEGKSTLKNYFLCGLWWGIAFWSFGFALLYFVPFMLYFILHEKTQLLRGRIWVFGGGAVLGSLILLIDNLVYNREALSVIISGEKSSLIAANWLVKFWKNLAQVFVFELPAFLGQESINDFVTKIPAISWLYYALFIAALALAVYIIASKKDFPSRNLSQFSIVFFCSHLAIYASTNFAGFSPRYFIPLYPFIAILIAQLILTLLEKNAITKYLGVLTLVVYFSIQTVFAARMAHNTNVKDIIMVEGNNVEHLIEALNSLGISHVHTGYFLKWRLIFQSDEKIIASCHNLGPKIKAYPEYERRVDMSRNYAVVLHTKGKHRRIFKEFLVNRRLKYNSQTVDDLTIFYDIEGNYRP